MGGLTSILARMRGRNSVPIWPISPYETRSSVTKPRVRPDDAPRISSALAYMGLSIAAAAPVSFQKHGVRLACKVEGETVP